VLPHPSLLPAAHLAQEDSPQPIYFPEYLEGVNVATPRYTPQTVRHILGTCSAVQEVLVKEEHKCCSR